MAEKPIPKPLYGCHFCSEEYSHFADELFWSEAFKTWVCDSCWDEHDEHWTVDKNIENETSSVRSYGICLQEELDNRAQKVPIVFSKNIKEIPVDVPVLILLTDGSIHSSIKRQSICTYEDRWAETYFYFDVVGIVNVETEESCYIDHEKVIGFTTIPKITNEE